MRTLLKHEMDHICGGMISPELVNGIHPDFQQGPSAGGGGGGVNAGGWYINWLPMDGSGGWSEFLDTMGMGGWTSPMIPGLSESYLSGTYNPFTNNTSITFHEGNTFETYTNDGNDNSIEFGHEFNVGGGAHVTLSGGYDANDGLNVHFNFIAN